MSGLEPGASRLAHPDLPTLRKYDTPGPRYTSYPPANHFSELYGPSDYAQSLQGLSAEVETPLALYVHLPFCGARCHFCGCNAVITNKRAVIELYVDYLLKEAELLGSTLGERRSIVQYHWGGGTPTHLSSADVRRLHGGLAEIFDFADDGERSIELDPRVTTHGDIALLSELGFNRVSLGVQDLDSRVQSAIGRGQTWDQTVVLIDSCRQFPFTSINLDLVYGLPCQTAVTFQATVDQVLDVRPDRLAVYSYAHVPWLRRNQRQIDESLLPPPDVKLELFLVARQTLMEAGYVQIGMDHFARADDELAIAQASGRLQRNFMGYSPRCCRDLVGLGISAIGSIDGNYAQNTKKLSRYYSSIEKGEFPIERGFQSTRDDRIRGQLIESLMCNFKMDWSALEFEHAIDPRSYFASELAEIAEPDGLIEQDLVVVTDDGIRVTSQGQLFVRNICMVFDARSRGADPDQPQHSKAI